MGSLFVHKMDQTLMILGSETNPILPLLMLYKLYLLHKQENIFSVQAAAIFALVIYWATRFLQRPSTTPLSKISPV